MTLRSSVAATVCVLWFAAAAHAQTGTISGTVTDAGTHAAPATPVSVDRYSADGEISVSVTTDAGGHYTFTNTPPGAYFIRAGSAPYVRELYSDIKCAAADCRVIAGSPVTVVAGVTSTVDFELDHGGVITGFVRRATDNGAVTDGLVYLYNASTAHVTTVSTGFDGSFVIPGLPTGTYYARAGYSPTVQRMALSELYGGVLCADSRDTDLFAFRRVDSSCRIIAGTPISVTQGAVTLGIDFQLDAASTISGSVVADGTSAPLGNVVIGVFSGDIEVARGLSVASSGGYVVPGLAPGTYQVRTITDGPYVDEWLGNVCVGCAGTRQTVVVNPGGHILGADFSLARGGAISGNITCQVVTFNLARLPQISAFNASGTLVRSRPTSPAATCSTSSIVAYAIEGLPPGQYYLLARDPLVSTFGIQSWGGSFIDHLYGGTACNTVDCDVRRGIPVTVTDGQTTSGIDFFATAGADSTNMLGESLPLRMFDSRGVELVGVVRGNISPPPLRWQVVGLPAGTYYAKYGDLLNGGISCVDCPPTSGMPIVIRPGDTTFTMNFGSQPSGPRVSGTVRDGASVPLSMITVDLLTDAAHLLRSTLSDQSGAYDFFGVPPGTYFLRTRNDRGYADEVYQDVACAACDPRLGTPVIVAAADVTGIDFGLAAGGAIAGVVRDASSGIVIPGVPISIFTSGLEAGRTVTNHAGVFRISVPAGTYRARAEATAGHGAEIFQESACASAGCAPTLGTPIVVGTFALASGIDFTPAACSAMTLSPPRLASGVVGIAYRQTLTVSGGTAPMAFRITTGAQPGLSINGDTGVISGTPASSGRFEFTVGVVDANGCGTARAFAVDIQDCRFTLSPAGATVDASGGRVTVGIIGPCGAQTVGNLPPFVSVSSNTPGNVALDVEANVSSASRSADVTIGRRVFSLRQAGQSSVPPFGAFDAPLDGSQVSGSLGLGGWALDDLGVTGVQIFRDPVGGEGAAQIFLGHAVFVRGARPDVVRAYPSYPLNDRAGWGFLILTNMLPNQGTGAVRIYAYAEDVQGLRTLLGAKTIIATNGSASEPFGAIDTPAQGATISGATYVNFGWALTPQPKIIPTDGSTIQVLIDGAPIGSPTYNQLRSDIQALFPGYANSGGAVGYKYLDTTALAEGQHTIAWIVTDSLGAGAGIGSRYFDVANSADAQPGESSGVESGRRTESLASTPSAASPVIAQTGEGEPLRLEAREDGSRRIALKAMERLELRLAEASETACSGTWAGYLVDDGTLGTLPVGATIDPAGTFYWQPGPGFTGSYHLMFVRTACDGAKERLTVRVIIRP